MKKKAGYMGIILALLFFILALCTNPPGKHIASYGTGKMEEYVGGDAYNFIIEAALRGGEISGALTAKAIYFGIAAVLAVLSCAFLDENSSETLRNDLSNIRSEITNTSQGIKQLSETIQQHDLLFRDALTDMRDSQAAMPMNPREQCSPIEQEPSDTEE